MKEKAEGRMPAQTTAKGWQERKGAKPTLNPEP